MEMTPQEQLKIENNPRFRLFLRRFWVKCREEYQKFSQTEKEICINEYLKESKK